MEPALDRRFATASELKDSLRHLQTQVARSDGDQELRDLVAKYG